MSKTTKYIWFNGDLVEWDKAQVHVMTHALHYASSVFEGERCYSGKIFKGHEHSLRLIESARLLDMVSPYTAEEIDRAKEEVLNANGFKDAYVRAVMWRGSGEDMGVSARRNPVRMAVAAWEWGSYYGDAKWQGAKLDIAKWKRPSPETIPTAAKAAGLYMICTMSKHAAEAKGCSDALFMDWEGYVAEATGVVILVPGADESADWPSVIAPLRSKLPDSGWSTLSLTLPGLAAALLQDPEWWVRLAAVSNAPLEFLEPLLSDPEAEIRDAAKARLAEANAA